jgi:hypothetical protein
MWKRIKSIFERPPKEPLFMGVRGDDVEMREAYSMAAKSIDEFVAHIRSGGDRTSAAKLRLKDPALSVKLGEDRFVYMWLADTRYLDDGAFVGTFFQVPSELSEWHQVGQQLQFEKKRHLRLVCKRRGRNARRLHDASAKIATPGGGANCI